MTDLLRRKVDELNDASELKTDVEPGFKRRRASGHAHKGACSAKCFPPDLAPALVRDPDAVGGTSND